MLYSKAFVLYVSRQQYSSPYSQLLSCSSISYPEKTWKWLYSFAKDADVCQDSSSTEIEEKLKVHGPVKTEDQKKFMTVSLSEFSNF